MEVIEGKFYIDGEIRAASIGIEEGRIVKIGKNLTGDRIIRIEEGTVFPSMVDMHVHMREPGYTWKEDFESGTLSALHGGVTFVLDMPNTKPPVDSPENFRTKLKIASSKSYVDFGIAYLLHKKIDRSIAEEVTSFKIYMSETTNVDPVNYLMIPELIKDIKKNITVHAEFQECIQKSKKEGGNLLYHDMSRPETCEVMAVRYLGTVGGSGFHIAHVSSPDTVELSRIFGFTKEVTPHHLFLNRDMDLGSLGKVNPPLRSPFISERLRYLLSSGYIDVVASDHSPHTLEEKSDFKAAPSGLPGVETSLPLLFQAYKDSILTLDVLVKVAMERPGFLLGIPKGKIAPGYDADLSVIRLSDSRRIKSSDMHYKCGWTPFENMWGIFPRKVFIRGEMALDNFEETVEPGFGIYYKSNR
ncbi:MAG: dihydroorotase [Thermoplasmata archaeon]